MFGTWFALILLKVGPEGMSEPPVESFDGKI